MFRCQTMLNRRFIWQSLAIHKDTSLLRQREVALHVYYILLHTISARIAQPFLSIRYVFQHSLRSTIFLYHFYIY